MTVDQTYSDPSTPSLVEGLFQPIIPESSGKVMDGQQETAHFNNAEGHVGKPESPHTLNTEGLPNPDVQIPDRQTNLYSQAVQRRSTPRTP